MGRRGVRFAGVAAAVVVAAVGTLRADDDGEAPGDVRVRIEPGTTVAYTQTIEWELAQKAGRKKYGSRGVTNHDWTLTAKEAAADGAVVVEISFGRAWGHFEATKTPRVDFDTDAEPLPDDPTQRPVAAPVHTGTTVSATLRADGTFQEVVALLATQADVVGPQPDRDRYGDFSASHGTLQPLRELALLLPTLPARPIPGGAFYEDEGLFGAPGYLTYRIARRNELARRNDTTAIVKCAGKVRDLTAPPKGSSRKKKDRRAGPEVAKGTFASSATVRREDGLPDEVNAELELLLRVDFGDDGKGTQSSEWRMTLRRREPAPTDAPTDDE